MARLFTLRLVLLAVAPIRPLGLPRAYVQDRHFTGPFLRCGGRRNRTAAQANFTPARCSGWMRKFLHSPMTIVIHLTGFFLQVGHPAAA